MRYTTSSRYSSIDPRIYTSNSTKTERVRFPNQIPEDLGHYFLKLEEGNPFIRLIYKETVLRILADQGDPLAKSIWAYLKRVKIPERDVLLEKCTVAESLLMRKLSQDQYKDLLEGRVPFTFTEDVGERHQQFLKPSKLRERAPINRPKKLHRRFVKLRKAIEYRSQTQQAQHDTELALT